MAAIIYDSVQFFKKIEKMKRAGGKANVAACQAWEIIEELANKKNLDLKLRNMLTQYGDARIKNCYKFDLRGAYRLVYVWHEEWFVILFLGSHDETDTWIRNNSGMIQDISQGEVVQCTNKDSESEQTQEEEDDKELFNDYDRPLDEFIDQKTLREIFCGISGHSN